MQTFTQYSILFLLTAIISFFGAFLAWQRKGVKGAIDIIWLMTSAGIASFCVFIASTYLNPESKIFWAKMEYSGAVCLPVFYFIFVLRFIGKDKYLTIKKILSLFIFPAITFALVLTNEKHHLIWSGFSPINPKTNMIVYYHGFWFWFGYIAYTYILMLIGNILLLKFIIKNKTIFKRQGWIVLIGCLIPWTVSLLYLLEINITPGLDITPASIILSGLLLIYSILNRGFLDLNPIRATLVETLHDGIITLDPQNRIQDINKAALSYLKIQNENVLGIIIDSVGISLDILNVLKNKTEDDTEISYNDGSKSFRIIKYPIKKYYGSHLIVIQDITERVKQTNELIKAKERAEESDNLKSAFLTNMSHEIRTPMNGIMGFAELLKEPKLTGIEQKEYIRIIKESGTRMLNIINDIICISSLETGHIKAYFSIVYITELVQSVYCFYKPLAKDKNIKLILINNIPEKDSRIKTDEKKVYSILNNIVNNAIKFTSSGYVEIKCDTTQCELIFSIKDTGLGISPEHKNIIFMNFRHGNELINKNYDGAGLGLSISKAYVEMIGGRIWVESEQEKGSTFYFTIPFIPI